MKASDSINMRDIKSLTFIWIFAVSLVYSQPQDCTGWFGSPCRYKCRCTTPCQPDGTCTAGGSCQPGWFGPACQYADVANTIPVTVQPAENQITVITDNNDTTCYTDTNAHSLTLTWNQRYLLTWLRVYTANIGAMPNLIIQLSDTRSTVYATCNIRSIFNGLYMDIFCDLTVPVNQVILTGEAVKSLCSLYISGGRNVALHQITSQSTTYLSYGSDKAVDGNTNGNFSSNTCTATESLDTSVWSINIAQPVTVYRYVVYNTIDVIPDRLKAFHLKSYDVRNALVYNYTDNSQIGQSMYAMVPTTASVSVSRVTIEAGYPNTALVLCEVEIYGETECVVGRYGRECENICNCADISEKCYVTIGGCLSGCAAGYFGENCQQPCPDGTYGNSCKYHCAHCASYTRGAQVCDRFNGICLQGCQDGYASIFCNQSCSDGRFGKDCLYNCPEKCVLNSHVIPVCDNINGTCLKGCQDGYMSSMCNQNCPSGKYGADCVYSCSKFCVVDGNNSSTCQHTDGSCPNGCLPGYDGARCNTDCARGTYGKDCRSICSKTCVLYNNIIECDHITGACECQIGYTMPWCNQPCPVGTFGQGCKSTCYPFCVLNNMNISDCDSVTGKCQCQSGYDAPWCNKEQVSPTQSPVGVLVGAVLGSVAAVGIIVGIVALVLRHRRKTQTSQNVRDSRPNVVVTAREGGTTSRVKLAEQSIMEINKKEPKSKRTNNTGSSHKASPYYNTISDPSSTPTQVNDIDTHVYDEIKKQEMDL